MSDFATETNLETRLSFCRLYPVVAILFLLVAACSENMSPDTADDDPAPVSETAAPIFFPGTISPAPDFICMGTPAQPRDLATQWDSISSLWDGSHGVVVTIDSRNVPFGEDRIRIPSNTIWYFGIDVDTQSVIFWGRSDTSYDYTAALNWTAGSCHPNTRPSCIQHHKLFEIGTTPGTGGGGTTDPGCVEAPANLPGSGTGEVHTIPGNVPVCEDYREMLQVAQDFQSGGKCHY